VGFVVSYWNTAPSRFHANNLDELTVLPSLTLLTEWNLSLQGTEVWSSRNICAVSWDPNTVPIE
jgi:hypothetical protein